MNLLFYVYISMFVMCMMMNVVVCDDDNFNKTNSVVDLLFFNKPKVSKKLFVIWETNIQYKDK